MPELLPACEMPCVKDHLSGTHGYAYIFDKSANGMYHYSKVADFYSLAKTLEYIMTNTDKEEFRSYLRPIVDNLLALTKDNNAIDAFIPLTASSGRGYGRKTRRTNRRKNHTRKNT